MQTSASTRSGRRRTVVEHVVVGRAATPRSSYDHPNAKSHGPRCLLIHCVRLGTILASPESAFVVPQLTSRVFQNDDALGVSTLPDTCKYPVHERHAVGFSNMQHTTFMARQSVVFLEGVAQEPVKIAYTDVGSGPALLLMHGIPTWSYLYHEVIDQLAQSFRVIAPDFIGHGCSFDVAYDPDEAHWQQIRLHHAWSENGVNDWQLDNEAFARAGDNDWAVDEVRSPSALIVRDQLWLYFAGHELDGTDPDHFAIGRLTEPPVLP